jgi:hypothetical protein
MLSFYWDGFLGICFVLVGLAAFLQKVSHTTGLLLSGLGMSGFSIARRNAHHIGNVRRSCNGYWPDLRKQAYPSFVFCLCWLAFSWGCFRYAALDFEMTAQWARRILYLNSTPSQVHRVSVSYPSLAAGMLVSSETADWGVLIILGVGGQIPSATAAVATAKRQQAVLALL